MRTQLKIDGTLQDVEIKNGEIIIIKESKKMTGWERLVLNTTYCTNIDGETQYITEFNEINDDQRYNLANYFSDGILAEDILRMQTLQRQMFRWQAENDTTIIHDNYTTPKYYISYDCSMKGFRVYSTTTHSHGFAPYFSSQEKAEECIKEFADELIWLFTEFKWRMDTE